ncbi:MAG: IS630 transposase-related protein [Cyanophyceae cyanobacterium]
MPFSYSADLRQKVLNAIDKGMRPSEASRVFQLSRNTIHLWRQQFEDKGTLVPEPPQKPARSRAAISDEEFTAFVECHRDWTLKEFAVQFGVAFQTISNYLKRLGYTRKKNLWLRGAR